MSEPIKPTTLEGIKRLAKQMRKAAPSLTYMQALEAAARAAGYNTYNGAKAALEA